MLLGVNTCDHCGDSRTVTVCKCGLALCSRHYECPECERPVSKMKLVRPKHSTLHKGGKNHE